MHPLVSVIVPVYKVEDCLVRCLDSLRRQSLSDIEILLIDDASPDRCGEICEAYAEKDARFRVFHNKLNGGLSAARNIGIANAYADYLMFVDSDDWVHVDFCKEPYECAVSYQTDLVMFRHDRIGYHKPLRINNKTNSFLKSGCKTCMEAMYLLQKVVGPPAWNKLYRKDLFQNISFPEGYFFEDIGTTYKTVWQSSRIYFLNKVLYYHAYHAGCISDLKTEKSLHDWIEMYLQQYRDLAAWGYPQDKLDALLKNVAISYCIKKRPDNSDKNYEFCKKVVLESKNIPAEFTREKKLMFALFKYCRPLFEFVCGLYGRKVG